MRILVVGGGIGGLALGIALARHGIAYEIVERRSSYGDEGAGIVLGGNVMAAMERLGLAEAIRSAGHPVGQAIIADAHGRRLQQTPFRVDGFPPAIAIHRTLLLDILRSALPVPVRLGTPFEAGGAAGFDLVVGADGIRSTVRRLVCGADVEPRFAGYTCWRFVVDGHFSEDAWEMWGRGRRFGVVPVGLQRTYCFLTENAARRAPDPWKDQAQFRERFAEFASPARDALAAVGSLDPLLHNDIEDCLSPRWWRPASDEGPAMVLIGDAAHAVTPNLGQGAGLAIEDAAALAELLSASQRTEDALARFEQLRRPRAEWILKQSWMLGRAAQLESGILRSVRDTLVAHTPERVTRASMERIVQMPGVPT
jgi:2-polyprenyl-6-methoxyphenol hydroxylase-like FAD-dependent oxidoreductase